MGLSGGGNLRYAYIQRNEYEPFVTIGEYIQLTAPEIFVKLLAFVGMEKVRDVTELVLAAADVVGMDKYYYSIMTERPKSGRGGLLPGEGEEALV